jgi:rubredoxin
MAMKKYACNNCVFTMECEELPADFVCPICGSGAEEFVEVSE